MTRDEHRATCLEAMEDGYWKRWEIPSQGDASVRDMLTAAFDSLHGIAFVDPIEATPEMIEEAIVSVPRPYELDMEDRTAHAEMIVAILAIGDLTNPPEGKL